MSPSPRTPHTLEEYTDDFDNIEYTMQRLILYEAQNKIEHETVQRMRLALQERRRLLLERFSTEYL
jgi:hypothetical protein